MPSQLIPRGVEESSEVRRRSIPRALHSAERADSSGLTAYPKESLSERGRVRAMRRPTHGATDMLGARRSHSTLRSALDVTGGSEEGACDGRGKHRTCAFHVFLGSDGQQTQVILRTVEQSCRLSRVSRTITARQCACAVRPEPRLSGGLSGYRVVP